MGVWSHRRGAVYGVVGARVEKLRTHDANLHHTAKDSFVIGDILISSTHCQESVILLFSDAQFGGPLQFVAHNWLGRYRSHDRSSKYYFEDGVRRTLTFIVLVGAPHSGHRSWDALRS